MKRITILLTPILIVCLVGLSIGCASTDAKKAAYVSRMSAEASYEAIYGQYLLGNVSEEDKNTAAEYYDMWYLAQMAAHDAIMLGESETEAAKMRAAGEMTAALLALALRLEVF